MFDTPSQDSVGTHSFNLKIESDINFTQLKKDMPAALPQFNITVNLQVVKSCKVTSFDTNDQSFDSLTLEVGDKISLPFISFKQ